MPTVNPSDVTELSYSYRPSVVGAGWNFRLTPDAIVWEAGRRSGRVPLTEVERVRMSFRPAAMQNHRFLTEVWSRDGTKLQIVSSSWKSMVQQTRLDGEYRAFVGELHRRLAATGLPIVFVSGAFPPLYWAGIAVFVLTACAIAVLTVRALQSGATSAALLIGLFLAAFLWQGGDYFRRNRPRLYRPDALPPNQLPSGR